MKKNKAIFFAKSHLPCKAILLLCLLGMLAVNACGTSPTPIPTTTPIPIPTIISSHACELAPGETIPLAVTGVTGGGVEYSWSASAGSIMPPTGPTVSFTAPPTTGDVIIKVVAQMGSETSDGMLICKIVATPTPNPTLTVTPPPTQSLCNGSTSSELIGKAWAGDPKTRLACAQLIIDRWTEDATNQQNAKNNGNCDYTPNTKDQQAVTKFQATYWALNDVGTAWLLKGYAFDDLGQPQDAQDAYKTVINNYSCAYAWDNGGFFWSVLKAAQGKIK
jgi:hypothetical protein